MKIFKDTLIKSTLTLDLNKAMNLVLDTEYKLWISYDNFTDGYIPILNYFGSNKKELNVGNIMLSHKEEIIVRNFVKLAKELVSLND